MTLTITLACGCCITLVSDGEHHRPAAPRPCAAHTFLAGAMLTKLLGTRVRVAVVEDDAQ